MGQPSRTGGVGVLESDGAPLTVEPVRPQDRDDLLALMGRLSERTRHQRFCGAGAASGSAYADLLLDPGRTAIGVVARREGQLVAVGSTHRLAGDEAELALTVDDREQGRGVGNLLLQELVRRSRDQGVGSLVAVLLGTNAQMLDVLRHSGLAFRIRRDGDLLFCRMALDDPGPMEASADERGLAARARSMDRLLRPSSLVVVGAGRRRDGVGHHVVERLRTVGYQGTVLVVNRSGRAVARAPAVTAVTDVPEGTDLAVVCVPDDDVVSTVRALAERHVHAVAVLARRDGEPRDHDCDARRAAELRVVCAAGGLRLLGPGASGLANTDPDVRLDATSFPHAVRAGAVLVGSSSGALAAGVVAGLARRAMGVSAVVTMGGAADIGVADVLAFAARDDRTRVVVLHWDHLADPTAVLRVGRLVSLTTPVIVIGPADHDEGGVMTALRRQAGFVTVRSLDDACDVAQVLCARTVPAGPRVVVVTNAVGPARLALRAAEDEGLLPAHLVQATAMRLNVLAGPGATHGGVVALPSGADVRLVRSAVATTLDDPDVDVLLATIAPHDRLPAAAARQTVDLAADEAQSVPVVLCLPGDDGDVSARVPTFTDPVRAVAAVAAAAGWSRWVQHRATAPSPTWWRPAVSHRFEQAERLVAVGARVVDASGRSWLEPHVARGVLRAYGVDLLPVVGVAGEAAAVEAAAELPFPLVLAREPSAWPDSSPDDLPGRPLADVRELVAALQQLTAGGSGTPPLVVRPALGAPRLAVRLLARRDASVGPVLRLGPAGAPCAPDDAWDAVLCPASVVEVEDVLRHAGWLRLVAHAPTPDGLHRLADLASRVSCLMADLAGVVTVDCGDVAVTASAAIAVEAHVEVRSS